MISFAVGLKRGDTSEEVFRLWLGRTTNRSTWIRFGLCGEIEDEEIGFKEITLCMVAPFPSALEKKKIAINGSNTFWIVIITPLPLLVYIDITSSCLQIFIVNSYF